MNNELTFTTGNGYTPVFKIVTTDTYAAVIDFRAAAIQALLDRWSNPDFWKEKGCQMDSIDCANELRIAIGELP